MESCCVRWPTWRVPKKVSSWNLGRDAFIVFVGIQVVQRCSSLATLTTARRREARRGMASSQAADVGMKLNRQTSVDSDFCRMRYSRKFHSGTYALRRLPGSSTRGNHHRCAAIFAYVVASVLRTCAILEICAGQGHQSRPFQDPVNPRQPSRSASAPLASRRAGRACTLPTS